ncbi:MAG TPA: PfkB family carbohydrate kinase [Candidatus Kapabacteria bacterium]|jgi:hypothetical protein|nr:PfkB family carbohydrate kinase [Candidatus Kapabacteria bacterium]
MRIGIIGQPCIDEIVAPDGSIQTRSLGGILYSYAAMERLMRDLGPASGEHSFVGLTWMSVPDADIIEPLLSQFHHLDRSIGLWKTEALTNRVRLVYSSAHERIEHCPNVLPRLTGFQLTPLLVSSLDVLFINIISGYDVSLETLEFALTHAERRPYVHLDIHALVLGPLSSATPQIDTFGEGRKPRGVRKWKRWLNLADSVQMNEFEARWLGNPEINSEEALLAFVERRRDQLAAHDIIITRAERGASLYEVRSGEVHHAAAQANSNSDKSATPTGSGDVFGSAYVFALLNGSAPDAALEAAVRMASWNATLSGIEEILSEP